ncbi:unnamed protein product [Pedinophyceae sp. YPF-701]|nr:unnamed protein product [Pedinophyceae sp. YPF-701]
MAARAAGRELRPEDEDFDDDESAPAPYVPLLVRDVMPTAVVTARPDQLVSELDLTQVTGMPVLDAAGAMVGVISKTDIETRAVDAETRVEDLMSRRIKVCRPNNTVAEAAAMMLKYKVHRLPVVKSNAKTGEISLVGIITRTDVYYALETGRL